MAKTPRGFVVPGNPGAILKAALTVFHNVFPQQFSDLYLSRFHKLHQGAVPFSPKVAIYLIFPKNGVLPTHLHSLRYMVENGYAPLVVANLPMQPQDVALLQEHAGGCWSVQISVTTLRLPRGYSSTAKPVAATEAATLLNDSAWFPLAGKMNWLAEAEAMGKDFVGAMESGFVRRTAGTSRTTKPANGPPDRTRKNFHYGSYALSIGPKPLGSRDFLNWWKKLRISWSAPHHQARRNRTLAMGDPQWFQPRSHKGCNGS